MRMASIAARIATSSATSIWTWAIAFTPSITTAVLHDRNLYGGSLGAWLFSALTGALAAGAVLGIAHLSLRGRHPFLGILVAFLAAGALRGVTIGLTASALGLVPDAQLAVRAVSGAILALFWLGIATVIVDGLRTHRHAQMALREQERVARHELSSAEKQLEQLHERTRDEITTGVSDQAARLRAIATSHSGHGNSAAELREIAGALHDLSQEVVRPMSHAAMLPTEPSNSRNSITVRLDSRRRAVRAVLTDTFLVRPFRPAWLILLLFPSILMTAVRGYEAFWGALGAAWIVAMAAVPLWLAERVVTPRLRRLSAAVRVISVLLVWAVAACASTIPVVLATQWGLGPDRAWAVFGVPLLAYVPITCIGIAIAGAISQVWALDEDDLAARITQLEWQAKRGQQSLWAERKRWGRFLHGSVQSTLTSTALFIQSSLRARMPEADIAGQALDRLEPLIVDSRLARYADSGSPLEFAPELRRIVGVWSRLAVINVDIAAEVNLALDSDPDAAERATEIIREGLANAIRHGRASEVAVRLSRSGASAIRITVIDNGIAQAAPSREEGLGSATLDDLCLEWKREGSTWSGTSLTCLILVEPCNSSADVGLGTQPA